MLSKEGYHYFVKFKEGEQLMLITIFEKQKNCKYCHKPFMPYFDSEDEERRFKDNVKRLGMEKTLEANSWSDNTYSQIQEYMNEDGYYLSSNFLGDGYDGGSVDVPLNYCPWCGRLLDSEDDK